MKPAPSADSLGRSAPRARVLLAFTLALVGMFAFIQVYSVQSVLAQLQQDLGASVVQIGNAVGMTILAVALISPFIGMLSDAFGRKWIIVASIFALALPTALMAQVSSVGGLMVLRFLQGLAVPGVSVVALAYVGEEYRGSAMIRTMTYYIAGTVMGGFLGRFLLGHLAELMHWRSAFLVMALLNALGAVVVWYGLPSSRNFVANRRFADSMATLTMLLRHPALHIACTLGFTMLFALVGVFTFVNLHLARAPYDFSSGDLANIFTVYLLGVVVTPLAGRLMPRLGVRNTVLLVLALSACGVLITLSKPSWLIIVGLALAACGVFIAQSANMSFIASKISSGRSLASGIYYATYYCGGFMGAWLCAIAYDWGAWPATVATLVAVQALGWILAWRYMPKS